MKAVLFDLDGTLIDSMPIHQRAWIDWHARRGLPMDEAAFFAATAGRTNAEILLEMLPERSAAERLAMADDKEAIYRALAEPSLALIDGARGFVEAARAAGFRLAVCTASTLPNMALAFALHGIDRWVDTVVSPADMASGNDMNASANAGTNPGTNAGVNDDSRAGRPLRGKPHPDIFLEAARRLGVAPADCLVVEDAPLGVEAARRAGMPAVALTTTLAAEAFAGFDNLIAIAADFTTLAPAALAAAFDRHDAHPDKKATHDA